MHGTPIRWLWPEGELTRDVVALYSMLCATQRCAICHTHICAMRYMLYTTQRYAICHTHVCAICYMLCTTQRHAIHRCGCFGFRQEAEIQRRHVSRLPAGAQLIFALFIFPSSFSLTGKRQICGHLYILQLHFLSQLKIARPACQLLSNVSSQKYIGK